MVVLKKNFQKQFNKLRPKEQARVIACLDDFERDPDLPSLRRHPLKGKYQHIMSISAGGDLRLHYYEEGDRVTFVFVSVGSHSQLYKP